MTGFTCKYTAYSTQDTHQGMQNTHGCGHTRTGRHVSAMTIPVPDPQHSGTCGPAAHRYQGTHALTDVHTLQHRF